VDVGSCWHFYPKKLVLSLDDNKPRIYISLTCHPKEFVLKAPTCAPYQVVAEINHPSAAWPPNKVSPLS
jgi:hypothetical protein